MQTIKSVGPEEERSLAVVTPTHNRLALLKRLYSSLIEQTNLGFVWIVIDDASTDGTSEWVTETSKHSPFEIIGLALERNSGKAAALNHAFSSVVAKWYSIVDSDDVLLSEGVSLIRQKCREMTSNQAVGAILFTYRETSGKLIGEPPHGIDLISTRAAMDATHGKYDGCVAYSREVIQQCQYPEFDHEVYVGPTVLQLMMSPPYKMLFTAVTVGIAEYQQNGLTKSGRALRLANPCGMMVYSKLHADKGVTRLWRFKYRISYWAYASHFDGRVSTQNRQLLTPPRSSVFDRLAGRLLRVVWQKKIARAQRN